MKYIFYLVLLIPFITTAQTVPLQGKVTDEGGTPIPGATIFLKKAGTTTISDASGLFAYEALIVPDTLVVTHTGFEKKEIPVHENQFITIILQRASKTLEEVIINTGYQTLAKERITGAIETIDQNAINYRVGADILSRLESTSSILFDKHRLRPPVIMRGISSILGAKDPLIVLDNFPYEGDINNINPNDVESITLLKDAAASSIWGAKAGNGVIVITTKKGKAGQRLKVELNTNFTVSSPPDFTTIQSISAPDFIELERFLFSKGFRFSDTLNMNKPAFSPVYEILFKQRRGLITSADADAQINALQDGDVLQQLNQHIYQPSFNKQYAINLRGGSGVHLYYISGGYDQQVNELNATYHRYSTRIENNFRLSTKYLLQTSFLYTKSHSHSGKPSYEILRRDLYPYTKFADSNGNALPLTRNLRETYIDTAGRGKLLDWRYYPLEDYKYSTSDRQLQDLVFNIGMQYKIIKQLQLDVKYQHQHQQMQNDFLQDENSYFTRDLINRYSQVNHTTGVVKYVVPKGGILDVNDQTLISNYFRSQLNYNHQSGKHSFSAIAGSELRASKIQISSNRVYGYNKDLLTSANVDYVNAYPGYHNNIQSFIPRNQSFKGSAKRYVSFYGNGSYTYNNQITLFASGRRDASNLFGVATNEKWQPLWSTGIAYTISNAPYYKSALFTYLKFRGSYGYSGNADESKSAVPTISYSSLPANFTNLSQAFISQYANPSLRWEKIRTINVGLDFNTSKEVVSGSIDVYFKKGTDLFGHAPVDYTNTGIRSLIMNIASTNGKGIDVQMNFRAIERTLKWHTTLFFNYADFKVTQYHLSSTRGFDHTSNGTTITAIEGYPVYSLLSFRWAGLDTLGNPLGVVEHQTTSNYSLITGTRTQLLDLVYGGSSTPPFYGSLINTITYKNLSLVFNIGYKLGHYFRKQSISYDQLYNLHNGHSDYALRWQKSGDELITTVPSMIYPNISNRDLFYNNSDVLVRKADHIRLQYININYDFGNHFQKAFIQNARLFLNVTNPGLLWKANNDGIDPEYEMLPPTKAFSFGVRATF